MFELTMVCRICKKELETEGYPDVERALEKEFSSWFKNYVSLFHIAPTNVACIANSLMHCILLVQIARLRHMEGEDINVDLYALSCEPDLRVRIFSACLVDGV